MLMDAARESNELIAARKRERVDGERDNHDGEMEELTMMRFESFLESQR